MVDTDYLSFITLLCLKTFIQDFTIYCLVGSCTRHDTIILTFYNTSICSSPLSFKIQRLEEIKTH